MTYNRPQNGIHRWFDVFCAASGLVILSPLLAAIAVAIKLQDGGPVLYSQWRVGRNFKPFRLYKFRSMVPDADRRGGLLTAPQDHRLTPLGRVLRRYKLDELPQLLNVIKGDMQLVGARPEVDRYVRMFPEEYAAILRDRPGITDPASVAFRHEDQMFGTGDVEQEYIERILPAKLSTSLDYARRRDLVSDLGVILGTVFGAALLPVRWRRGRPRPLSIGD
jgi:lipopolysaccharide/colanic/teichoic acid biosynthesis glycosyltransferase